MTTIKNIIAILAGLAIIVAAYFIIKPDSATLYIDGAPEYVIIYSADALPAEVTAVKELSKYLKLITGTEPQAVTDAEAVPGRKEIIVGRTNREDDSFSIDRSVLKGDGLIIKWHKKSVYLTGREENYGRGTLYAAYEFLRQMGCEFYAKDTETIPETKTLKVKRTDTVQESPFKNRDVYWSCVFGEEISAKLRLNGCVTSADRNITPAFGGMNTYTTNRYEHTFDQLVPPEEYFETHPEYFSEINGERSCEHLFTQLCMSNPEVVKIAVEKAKEWIREDPSAPIISISQNDSYVIESYCTCEECRRINEEEGSPSGALLRFVNAVADGIREEFPDMLIDMLSYQYSAQPPQKTVPRDYVIVRFCTGACYPHPIAECPHNASVKSNIEGWSRICKHLHIWDYTPNFAQYLCPIANFYSFGPNMQFFRDNGVESVFEQGMYQDGESGEWGELRAYVLAKLMWNPDENVDKLIDNFIKAYYGPGAAGVRAYFDLLHKRALEQDIHFGPAFSCGDMFRNLFSDEDLVFLDNAFDEAIAACAPESKELNHILRAQISYRFYKMDCGREEFAADRETAEKEFNADCRRLGVTRFNEGENIPWIEVE